MTYYDDVINRDVTYLGSKDVLIKKNSCAKAIGNRSRNKNLKPKKSRGGVSN